MLIYPVELRSLLKGAVSCSVSRAALILSLLIVPQICLAQALPADPFPPGEGSLPVPSPSPPVKIVKVSDSDQAPLTDRERAMLELIKNLQERVTKLEAAQTTADKVQGPPTSPSDPAAVTTKQDDTGVSTASTSSPAEPEAKQEKDGRWGKYTPNLGYQIVNTEYGDVNLSIYTYARYLNQLGLDGSYTDAFGNEKSVQRRQDIQLTKMQIKFLGWVLSPKLRYFLYAWSSNANQGLGAQVVLAGNLQYTFNDKITIGAGIRSLPGTRSVEGNFPFWPNVDSRHIADEFFRPSYTSGFWAMGNLTKRLKYITMIGNNMSTLGVPANRIDNGLNTFSSSLVWFPTGDFEKGFSGQGWGDFEHHDKFSTRLGFHYTHSKENKESQPTSETFENTQIRLSDGTVIFTPNIFGKGVNITDVRYQMTSYDAAFKYKGWSLEGEYFTRWLNDFKGMGVEVVPDQFDHGFQLQLTKMLVPKSVQAYAGYSQIYGNYGDPYDFRMGTNWFPFKNKVVRWNTEALYVHKSPVGYTSVTYPVGGRGWVFNSTFELAF
ncbi:MAG: hypothetical protein DMF63_00050 [Acidobacteria bacterium]|nr:MAG: hypothetical protein DMF63_00050 [Acidobacteriota bacterium]